MAINFILFYFFLASLKPSQQKKKKNDINYEAANMILEQIRLLCCPTLFRVDPWLNDFFFYPQENNKGAVRGLPDIGLAIVA